MYIFCIYYVRSTKYLIIISLLLHNKMGDSQLVLRLDQIIEYSSPFIIKYLNKNGCTLNAYMLGMLMGSFNAVDMETGGLVVKKETYIGISVKFYKSVFNYMNNNQMIRNDCQESLFKWFQTCEDNTAINIMETIYDIAQEKYKRYKSKRRSILKKCIIM